MLKTGVILAERYRLDDPIAAGGVGQVWRATDLILQRRVAVKLLRPEYADHPETLSRFQAEARHAGSLAHPAIAQVYDYGDNPYEGPPYLVMELVDGPSLADVLAVEPVTPAYALDVLAKAASGLAAAHQAGVVHRDIKPGNILLGQDGQVKITDFGIAFALGSAPVTDPGLVMGTTQYLAPERIAGGSGTPAADLYSLGIVMHECLTGVPPYEGTPAEVMAGHLYVPLPPLPSGTPPEVEDLIARLTAKDPDQRLSDAGELAALARRVRSVITGQPMPRQRQVSSLPPTPGGTPPGGTPPGGTAPGGTAPGGTPPGGPFPHSPVTGSVITSAPLADSPAAGNPVTGNPAGPGSALALRGPDGVLSRPITHAIHGVLVDTDPFAVADAMAADPVPPRPPDPRQSGDLAPVKRRGRRRAAIGIGVLILASGAGLGGAYAAGALRLSPAASHSTRYPPPLSEVQPNTSSPPDSTPGKGGKQAKPSASKQAKASPSASAPGSAPAAPPASAPAVNPGPGAPNPPHHGQAPACLLGVLCP